MTSPRDELLPERPMHALFSFQNFASIIGHLAIQWAWQIGAVAFVTSQSWYGVACEESVLTDADAGLSGRRTSIPTKILI